MFLVIYSPINPWAQNLIYTYSHAEVQMIFTDQSETKPTHTPGREANVTYQRQLTPCLPVDGVATMKYSDFFEHP